MFSPFYENYVADTILSGAEPIYVTLRPPDFGFDPEELRRAFAQKPKALVLCNPSNPSGKVFAELFDGGRGGAVAGGGRRGPGIAGELLPGTANHVCRETRGVLKMSRPGRAELHPAAGRLLRDG